MDLLRPFKTLPGLNGLKTGPIENYRLRSIRHECNKQTVVANSKTEAEYMAASSCCGQFWSTVMAKTINGEEQLHALVDGKKIIITESSVRRDLQLADEEDEVVHKELGDSLVRAATTASSLEAEQDSGNINKTQSKATPNESSSQGTNSGGGPWCQETMGDTIAQTRRVKKHEKKDRSRTYRLKRLYKVGLTARVESSVNEESLGEDASKQGRIDAIDADEEIILVSVHDVHVSAGEEVFVAEQDVVEEVVEVINTAKLIIDAAQVSAAGDIVSTASAATTVSAATTTPATIKTVDDITLAQPLKEMKSTNPKKKGVVIQDLGESTTTISSQLSSQQLQEKGKGILIEPVKPMNKKNQIRNDEETALNLQAKFDEEERLAREKAGKKIQYCLD
ncbi:hypothetical protein Tco_0940887 [Tanacetum coccineum]|uniref:Uncharacterized protein n=1 Tax=Tanacetum coccineum TaxID=301880 RepID=A0ABQ5DPK0_9ASTR